MLTCVRSAHSPVLSEALKVWSLSAGNQLLSRLHSLHDVSTQSLIHFFKVNCRVCVDPVTVETCRFIGCGHLERMTRQRDKNRHADLHQQWIENSEQPTLYIDIYRSMHESFSVIFIQFIPLISLSWSVELLHEHNHLMHYTTILCTNNTFGAFFSQRLPGFVTNQRACRAFTSFFFVLLIQRLFEKQNATLLIWLDFISWFLGTAPQHEGYLGPCPLYIA